MIAMSFCKTPIDMGYIEYKDGYKYQLHRTYILSTSLRPGEKIISKYFTLLKNGRLIVKEGYCWDGPSGLTIDTLTAMRGSLIHDVLYQMMRESLISRSWRKYADELLRDICKIDGMYWWRAAYWYRGVRVGAEKFTNPKYKKKIITAPKRIKV